MKRMAHGNFGRENIILVPLLFLRCTRTSWCACSPWCVHVCCKLRSKNWLRVVFDSLDVQFCFHLHHRIALVWSPWGPLYAYTQIHLVCENAYFFSPMVIGRSLSWKWVRWARISSFLSAMPEQMHRRLIFTWTRFSRPRTRWRGRKRSKRLALPSSSAEKAPWRWWRCATLNRWAQCSWTY